MKVLRSLAALVLTPCLTLSPALVPEHAHEADADHPQATVHRHLEPHAADIHDDDHAEFAEDGDHVVWLDGTTAVCPGCVQLTAPSARAIAAVKVAVPLVRWTAQPDYDTAPPHGPPRQTPGLRGPPSFAA